MKISFLKFFVFITLFIFISFTANSESFISYLEGTVLITREGGVIEGNFGTTLQQGDLIKTESDSLAVLDIEGRGTLKLREDTELLLQGLEDKISIDLKEGGLFSRIKKLLGTSYEVRSNAVVAGVRGTEFFMAYGRLIEDTPDIWLCVNEGTVQVSVGDEGESLLVHRGEGITIPGGNRLTDPRFYKWTVELNWNSDPGKGEMRDVTDLSGAYADLRDFDYD